jgi:hypothetical protein
MKHWLLYFTLLISSLSLGQQSRFFEPSDSLNKKRAIGLSIGLGTSSVGSLVGLGTIWYDDLGTNGFKFRDDWRHWLQMDKVGHAYSGYFITSTVFQPYRWTGLNKDKSLIIGSAVGFGYLLSFEILDGLSDDWGFSWSDVGANTVGVGLFFAQQEFWQEQRIRMKFSTSASTYAQYRPEVLGSNFSERLLKDYNGQTYWLCVNPHSFLKENTRFPTWLNVAVGYSIDERLYGSQNTATIDIGGEHLIFNSKRQYLLSLDIDLQKIPVKQPWLKTLFHVLNYIKIPFPALEYSNTGIKFHGIYF